MLSSTLLTLRNQISSLPRNIKCRIFETCIKKRIFYQISPSEDGFDGSGIWSIVSTELSKKIGSDVTHFKLDEHETNVYLNIEHLVLQ